MSYISSSYSQTTENILTDIIVQKIPEQWFNILKKEDEGSNIVEATSLYNSPHSTWYTVDITNEDILTIPQAEDPSWIAVGKINGRYSLVSNEYKITINNWKQGWDISDLDCDSIYVIYWPNILGYLGYILILLEGIVLTVKLFKKEKHE